MVLDCYTILRGSDISLSQSSPVRRDSAKQATKKIKISGNAEHQCQDLSLLPGIRYAMVF